MSRMNNLVVEINSMNKNVYDQIRKPTPPPGKAHSSKKGGKGYSRKTKHKARRSA